MEAEKEQERSESRGTDGRSNLGSTSSIMSRSPMAVDENEGRKQKTPPSDDHGNKTTETPKKQKLCMKSRVAMQIWILNAETMRGYQKVVSVGLPALIYRRYVRYISCGGVQSPSFASPGIRFPRAFKLSLKKLREETADESKGGKKSKGDDKNTDSDDMKIKIDGSGKEARNSSTEGGTSTQSGSGGSSMETEGETTEETEEKLGGEESDVSDSEEKEEEELDKMPPATPAEIRVIMVSKHNP
eukprot:jgi/Bigna1/66060/fgenesh1_pg.1_\